MYAQFTALLSFFGRRLIKLYHLIRIFLVIGIEVFGAMFCGPNADPLMSKVAISNYSKTTFRAFLDFLYADQHVSFERD